MRARLLFVGDLHLGRRSGILPESLLERGLRPADLGPAAAWRLCCEQAIAEKVDAVVLAGDVVESREDRIEGWSQLEAGVGRLVAAGIPVVGVAGNHDGLVLPALADRIEGFRLLGRGGRWETIELVGPGGPFRLLGWSFPDQYVTASPLEDLPGDFLGDGPLLGVLHADLDQAGSRYAPVTRAALEATPVDAWFLGHVHAPSELAGPRPIGYLGSVCGLDPGEPGPHGPWRVSLEEDGGVQVEHRVLAPLRWERLRVDLSGLEAAGAEPAVALADRILTAIEERAQAIGPNQAQAVGCRVFLTGATSAHHEVAAFVNGEAWRDLGREVGGAWWFLEKLIDDARPIQDLARLASGRDPVALLARRLLALEEGGPAAEALIERAAARLRALADRAEPWGRLPEEDRAFDPVVLLRRAGLRVLDEILARQQEEVER